MSDLNATLALPNPNTPLAFFNPTAAYQTSVATYVLTGSVGVMVWDILDNIRAEYRLLFKSSFGIVTVVYFGSRIGSLGFGLGASVFRTAPIGVCPHFETINNVWYPIGISCTGLLFFFRLRAIYNRDRLVVACFFALWLGLLGCTLTIPIGVLGGYIGDTKYCTETFIPNFAYASILAPLIHDTLVFVAITWRLAHNAYIDMTLQNGLRVAMFGKYLPAFTRGLLLDGQRYYLISLVSNLAVVLMVFDKNLSDPLRSMGATSNIIITNIMACRVYRHTRFGKDREAENSTSAMQAQRPTASMQFATVHVINTSGVSTSDTTQNADSIAYSRSDITSKDEGVVKVTALESRSAGDVESQTNTEKSNMEK